MTVHEGKWKWLVMYIIDVVVYEGVGRSKETLLAGYNEGVYWVLLWYSPMKYTCIPSAIYHAFPVPVPHVRNLCVPLCTRGLFPPAFLMHFLWVQLLT